MRLRMKTNTDVRRALQRVANMVLSGEIPAKEANTVIYACNVILQSLRIDEQEKRINQLETMLDELSEGNGCTQTDGSKHWKSA